MNLAIMNSTIPIPASTSLLQPIIASSLVDSSSISNSNLNFSAAHLSADNDDNGGGNGTGVGQVKPRGGGPRSQSLFEDVIRIIVPVLFALVVVTGVIGNTLVILVVAVNRQMRNSTNLLVVNLAVADAMFLIFCVPFTAMKYALSTWIFAWWWCPTMIFFQYMSAYVSCWNLVLLALDRFLAVVCPIWSRKYRNGRNTGIGIGIIWLMAIALCVKTASVYKVHPYKYYGQSRSMCIYVRHLSREASKQEILFVYLTMNLASFVFPVLIIIVLYTSLLIKFTSMGAPSGGGSDGNGNKTGSSVRKISAARLAAKRKITYMSLAVVITFCLCWLPINLAMMINAVKYPQIIVKQIWIIYSISAQVLAYSNACINPFLYGFFSANFRKGFYKIFEALSILIHFERGQRFFGIRAMSSRQKRQYLAASIGGGHHHPQHQNHRLSGREVVAAGGPVIVVDRGGGKGRSRRHRAASAYSNSPDNGNNKDSATDTARNGRCQHHRHQQRRSLFRSSSTSSTAAAAAADGSEVRRSTKSRFIPAWFHHRKSTTKKVSRRWQRLSGRGQQKQKKGFVSNMMLDDAPESNNYSIMKIQKNKKKWITASFYTKTAIFISL